MSRTARTRARASTINVPDRKLLAAPHFSTRAPTDAEILEFASPLTASTPQIAAFRRKNQPHIRRGLRYREKMFAQRRPVLFSALHIHNLRASGEIEDLGLVGILVVTTAGVNAIRDAFRNTFELETFNYHGIGTGGTAEAVGDTALVTELTTQYNPDNTRATGTQSSPGAGDYRTVGVNTVDATVAITEHGVLSQAATGGGTLLDRTLFSADNLVSGDSIQTTYDIVFSAGG